MPVTLTITDKGQITLKKEVLAHLGAKPGDKVEAELKADGKLLVSKPAGLPWSRLVGMLHDPSQPPLSLEDMDQMIMDAVEEQDSRSRGGSR